MGAAALVWTLELDGAGTYEVTAHVKPGSDGAHAGSVAFAEDSGRCRVSVGGAIRDVELAFVSEDGAVLEAVPLAPRDDGAYEGRCTRPSVPHRALVRGFDGQGARFQRIESALH